MSPAQTDSYVYQLEPWPAGTDRQRRHQQSGSRTEVLSAVGQPSTRQGVEMIGSPRTSRVVAIAVVLLLAAAACGDDDGSGANPERFCEINAELEQQDDDPFELPPDEARDALREFRNLVDEAVKVAPDEIRSSVEAVADSFTPVFDFYEATDFDISNIDEAEVDALFAAAFSDETVDEGAAMDEWIAANCSA